MTNDIQIWYCDSEMKTWKTRQGRIRTRPKDRYEFLEYLSTLPSVVDSIDWQCGCGTCRIVEYKGRLYCPMCGKVKEYYTDYKWHYYTKQDIVKPKA